MSVIRLLPVIVGSTALLTGCGQGGAVPTSASALSGAGASSTVGSAPSPAASASVGGDVAGVHCDHDALTPMCVTFKLTGAVSLDGTDNEHAPVSDGLARSCEQYLAGSGAGESAYLQLPGASVVGLGGITAILDISVRHYHGPGTYGSADMHVETSTLGQTQFTSGPATSVTATINPDGGGTYTLSSLVSADGKTESGEVSWSCGFSHT